MLLKPNDRVLFQGDSVTDAGRSAPANNNDGMGAGYAHMIASLLLARLPEMNLVFLNRGVSGNRVYDLEARLQADVLGLKPTVVSILIGINDTWRRYDSNTPSPIPEFTASYKRVLRAILDKLEARLVICEPFLLPAPPERRQYREDLNPRIDAVRDLAWEFRACYVPLDGVFAAAACRRPAAYWLSDGVHPSAAGHALIAEEWIKAVSV